MASRELKVKLRVKHRLLRRSRTLLVAFAAGRPFKRLTPRAGLWRYVPNWRQRMRKRKEAESFLALAASLGPDPELKAGENT